MHQITYSLPKTTIKQAIKTATHCDKLKQACEIMAHDTGVPAHIIYTTSQGSYSPKYFLYLIAYLGRYVDIDLLLRISEIQSTINYPGDRF